MACPRLRVRVSTLVEVAHRASPRAEAISLDSPCALLRRRRWHGKPADAASTSAAAAPETEGVNFWRADALPANDAIDKQMPAPLRPAMLNFLISPLVGAVDVFWVGRMGACGAPPPRVRRTRCSRARSGSSRSCPPSSRRWWRKPPPPGTPRRSARATGEAIFVASLVGFFGMLLLTFMQDRALSIVGIVPGSPTATQAGPSPAGAR